MNFTHIMVSFFVLAATVIDVWWAGQILERSRWALFGLHFPRNLRCEFASTLVEYAFEPIVCVSSDFSSTFYIRR